MKDEHLKYILYDAELSASDKAKYESHMVALYLNICSCLTKMGKKDDALFSADEALKIENSFKAHYRKSQAYLNEINRTKDDIRLAILSLKEAYNISQDPFFIREMHAAKSSYENDKQQSQKWFKNMLEKKPQKTALPPSEPETNPVPDAYKPKRSEEFEVLKLATNDENKKLECAKEYLKRYLRKEEWRREYETEFIKRYGSKIYSILKIDGNEQITNEYRSVLARSLEAERGRHGEPAFKEWL